MRHGSGDDIAPDNDLIYFLTTDLGQYGFESR